MGLSGGWMTICAFGILLQTMCIVILVALTASYVHEEVILTKFMFSICQTWNLIAHILAAYFKRPKFVCCTLFHEEANSIDTIIRETALLVRTHLAINLPWQYSQQDSICNLYLIKSTTLVVFYVLVRLGHRCRLSLKVLSIHV